MSEVLGKSGVCDICNASISSPSGYVLTSREVVSSPRYWRHYFQVHEGEFKLMGIASYDEFLRNPAVRTMSGDTLAGQRTPWMVCEKCISMFDIDREQARGYAVRWWQSGGTVLPPGTGPAPSSAIHMEDTATAPPAAVTGQRPAAGPLGKRMTHLLILLESDPVGGATYFTQQLTANLYDSATGRPYDDYIDADTKVVLKVVGSQDFDDQYVLMSTLFLTWGPMESRTITHQRFHGRGGNGTTVEVWSQP